MSELILFVSFQLTLVSEHNHNGLFLVFKPPNLDLAQRNINQPIFVFRFSGYKRNKTEKARYMNWLMFHLFNKAVSQTCTYYFLFQLGHYIPLLVISFYFLY